MSTRNPTVCFKYERELVFDHVSFILAFLRSSQRRGDMMWKGVFQWTLAEGSWERWKLKGDDGYLSSVSMGLSRCWRPIDYRSVWLCCGQSEDEPDCTGLCLLLTFLVITVIVIIVPVILILFFVFLPTITQLIVCRSNDGTCEVSWKMLAEPCGKGWRTVK